MTKVTKRVLSLIITGMMIFSILCAPAAAAEVSAEVGVAPGITVSDYNYTGYFRGSASNMNSIAGNTSKIVSMTSGGMSDTAEVTSIDLSVTVSKGSSDFYLVLESPKGRLAYIYVEGSMTNKVTRKYTVHDLDGQLAEGTWYVAICTISTASTAVATASMSMTCYYGYDQYV